MRKQLLLGSIFDLGQTDPCCETPTPGGGGLEKVVFAASTDDSSVVIPAGSYILRILVNPTSTLAAFTIGTLPGQEDVQFEIEIEADGEYTILLTDFYTINEVTLYMEGITSLTNFIIYYT